MESIMEASVKSLYISTSANRYSHCSARHSKGLVAFGAGRGIALWDSINERSELVDQVLPGHEREVVSVAFLDPTSSSTTAFVSGDASGTCIMWSQDGSSGEWERRTTLPDHTASVTAISSLRASSWIGKEGAGDRFVVATASSDCKVLIWLVPLDGSEPELLQTITSKKIPLALALSTFPGTDVPILSMSSTDRKINIYTFQPESLSFSFSLALEGHMDWVRALDFSPPGTSAPTTVTESPTPEVLLASGSQDGYIRLWSLVPIEQVPDEGSAPAEQREGAEGGELDDQMLKDFERKIGGGDGDEGGNVGQVSMKAFVISTKGRNGKSSLFSLSLSAVLLGHDTWVTSLHFSPASAFSPTRPLQLLSSSADNSLILWSPTPPSSAAGKLSTQTLSSAGIWFALHRFGQVSVKGLGFFGALWGKDAREVMASGWAGGWNVWREESEGGKWEESMGPTGHFDQVKSVAWGGRQGREWILSVSSDETSRIHAPWTRPSPSTDSSPSPTTTTWAEIARPQVHGYPLTSVATVPGTQRFVSGADEKVVRVFEETAGFVESLDRMGVALGTAEERAGEAKKAVGASVPPLGLSNKMLMSEEEETEAATDDGGFNYTHFSISHAMSSPPSENTLSTSTLWPELEKLYGHGYELMAVAVSHRSSVLATSCKATTSAHAVVRLFSTSSWRPLDRPLLAGHALTVTRIAFSADDRFLVTVGRDRAWCLFQRDADNQGYSPYLSHPRPHARIIWDVAFAPLSPALPRCFATASCDKSVKLWLAPSSLASSLPEQGAAQEGEKQLWECGKTLKFEEGVTSVDFLDRPLADGSLLLAVGLETGQIHLLVSSPTSTSFSAAPLKEWRTVGVLSQSTAHLEPVTRLAFRPFTPIPSPSDEPVLLASASDDRSVRVFHVSLPSPSPPPSAT